MGDTYGLPVANRVEGTVYDAWDTLRGDDMPPPDDDCEFCAYRSDAQAIEVASTP